MASNPNQSARSTTRGAARHAAAAAADAALEFEIVDHVSGALRYLEHGYPHPLVRWHCHHAYELHYIVDTSGKVFVGDYIGRFEPGNLILTGPRLPHNWISDIDPGERLALRDMVVQFQHDMFVDLARLMPEVRELMPLLEAARYGIEFQGMAARAAYYFPAIRDAGGAMRVGYLLQLLHELSACRDYQLLSSTRMESSLDADAAEKINRIVDYVMANYAQPIALARVAGMAGMNESYFSRFFKKSTGNSFNGFLTQIRIGKACDLLVNTDRQITNICYEVGYNNVANFNRRFLMQKKITPREYRNQARQRLTRGGGIAD